MRILDLSLSDYKTLTFEWKAPQSNPQSDKIIRSYSVLNKSKQRLLKIETWYDIYSIQSLEAKFEVRFDVGSALEKIRG